MRTKNLTVKGWAIARTHPKYGGAILIANSFEIYKTKADAERLSIFIKYGKCLCKAVPCKISYKIKLAANQTRKKGRERK